MLEKFLYLSATWSVLASIYMLFSNRKRRISVLLKKDKKNKISVPTNLSDSNFNSIIDIISKERKYRLEHVNLEENTYILSDKRGIFTDGYYYLIELQNNELNIYLTPKNGFEFNKFGSYSNRLERLAALIRINEKNILSFGV
jgi:hypothetical protein